MLSIAKTTRHLFDHRGQAGMGSPVIPPITPAHMAPDIDSVLGQSTLSTRQGCRIPNSTVYNSLGFFHNDLSRFYGFWRSKLFDSIDFVNGWFGSSFIHIDHYKLGSSTKNDKDF